ncbi:MAG TPA: DUF3300 domain-containing protein, partial [Bryobacteraceae bacterium]|nr:DUF3300 domain-containing protein [Bryobacteraceae bacterium]
ADQLDNLVAPIALYPDPLLGQILAASTYPLEIVEAQQWLEQHKNLSGEKLINEAKKQNWDPSVQALVVMPDVLTRLNQDISWTTDLGNAYLAQTSDVMNAVQRMRAKAQANGKLKSSEQQNVTTTTNDGQSAIEIVPTNPEEIYVPYYNPEYIWGPPLIGFYPPLFYPGIDIGFSFFPGIYIGGFFGGCCGWGAFGWGWWPGWFEGHLLVNNYFLHRYGFRDFHGGEFRGTEAWAHNPEHRLGVPYPNQALRNQYRGAAGVARGGVQRGGAGGRVSPQAAQGRFGSPGFEQRAPANHSAFGGIQNGGAARMQSDHGFSSMGSRGFGGFRGGAGGGRGRR